MFDLRTLGHGDEAALGTFLSEHADSSMFLRSNSLAAGLVDEGKPLQGTYVAAFEGGRMVAVAAHCWNGMVVIQAPTHTAEVTRAAVQRSGRQVRGISAPLEQVLIAREELQIDPARVCKSSPERLYALSLADLIVPEALSRGEVRCRRAEEGDLERLTQLRVDYGIEALGQPPGDALLEASREDIALHIARGTGFVLLAGEELVACAMYNARVPDCVQIGGVFTPRPLRGRGHGRAVVAGALLLARDEGARRAVLFTPEENIPAQAAYVALGFARVGDHGLLLLED